MKQITSIILAALFVGCGTTRDQRCGTYRTTYELYRASTALREPSQMEVDAAHAASVFLTIYCGWTKTRGVDQHGVPVIVEGKR
jgi:hypothetical protein